ALALSAVVAITLTSIGAHPQPLIAQASPNSQLASLPFADSAFERVWMRNDQPVASRAVARTWTWGPAPLMAGLEPYAEAQDGSGMRLVQYFDKSRMEINNPRSSPDNKWFVTNGLLT